MANQSDTGEEGSMRLKKGSRSEWSRVRLALRIKESGDLKEIVVGSIPPSGFTNFVVKTPEDDNRERLTCSDCGWIHYENPRVIVSAVVVHDNQILLCRRAIRPRYGFWTIPGGFMELGETPEEGAQREVLEEAGARVLIRQLLAVYAIPRIGQVHLTYLADLSEPEFSAGTESLDVRLFPLNRSELPWDELAFPVNHWALRDFLCLEGRPVAQPFVATPEDLTQRMSKVEHHPDFPPPEGCRAATPITIRSIQTS